MLTSPTTGSLAPRARQRQTETGTACRAKRQQPLGWPSAMALARPAASGSHAPHQSPIPTTSTACGRRRRGARVPRGGGVGLPYRLHHPLLGHATDSGGPREGVAGNGKRRYRLGFGHLRRPGALQGHHGEPRATRSAHAQAGEQRGAGTALPVAGRAAHHTKPGEASEGVCCVRGPRSRERRQAEHGRAGSGRSLHTPPHPPPHRHGGQR